MYFIGFNSGDLEDTVQDWVVVNELDGDEDQWDEEEWGFFLELSLKVFNEDIFDEVRNLRVVVQQIIILLTEIFSCAIITSLIFSLLTIKNISDKSPRIFKSP